MKTAKSTRTVKNATTAKAAKTVKSTASLMEKIIVIEERARFEEAHARVAEAKLRRMVALAEIEKLNVKK